MLSQNAPSIFTSSSKHQQHHDSPSVSSLSTPRKTSHARALSRGVGPSSLNPGSRSVSDENEGQGQKVDAIRSKLGLRTWSTAVPGERMEV